MPDVSLHYLSDHPHHVPACARWEHAQWGAAGGKTFDQAMAAYADTRRDGLPLTLIACTRADEVVGMVSLWHSDCPLRPDLTPWVASLFVPPQARGRGIGTLLFTRIRAEAARLGLSRLYLVTQHSEAVYARQGWQRFARIDGPGAMADAVLMRLEMAAEPGPCYSSASHRMGMGETS